MQNSIIESRDLNLVSAELDLLHAEICRAAEKPLAEARALPAQAFTDQAHFVWERETILKRQWLSIAHVSQLKNPGDYVNLELLGERLSVVNSGDGVIKVLSRVCAHRGMDVMPPEYGHESEGNCHQYRCPYHHWVYGIDGKLKGAPLMKEHQEVASKSLQLFEFNSAVWQGFVFINFSGDAQAIDEQFSGLDKYLSRWQIADLTMVGDIAWDCPFNWKVLVENFMEPYHHVGAHHTLFQPIMPAQGCWTDEEGEHFQVCHLPLSEPLQQKVKGGEPQLLSFMPMPALVESDFLEWTVYLAAPSTLLFVAADRVYWYRLEPISAERMQIRTTMLVHPDSANAENYPQTLADEIELMRKFHLEDMEMCGAVQSGLASAAYRPGPLNPLEQPIWLFQRYLARQIKRAKGA
ncbi:aromatic ring-hydroxylating dioxygenase subunit alpha [Halieaceae bacterium IMCC14734]|uniref:Aromatic ring-hydroxylating dioxygenase subunit alpha n=1 Tax=Candidatus Litorirhabdus singularis TaxID=2518993 RepID=A0ABT3TF24_9GAMM|nr:aromatic ring-hydroxylating dioxygenase subunit alpha [Candidatus Litorirhabdus singularis]MCX2980790.1 aromatic ring-hydroxylating dioxygenase subunit alpha [Candidatus Litorirhabdus singularis]